MGLLVVWTTLITVLVVPWTSYQSHTHWQRVAWIPFVSPPLRVRDVVVNVLLYAPWGYFLMRSMSARAQRIWIVVVVGALLSLGTEASQLYSHGRFPSATDLACNVVGALVGAWYARRRSSMKDGDHR